ncbi:preprotein translocase subunit SecG [bacterium]|nr:preprotein translocase subunit SecG [bacterium]
MLYILVLVLLVIVSVCLVGVVLLQSGKGNNLTNAFESEATFGNRSGDVLTKSTMVLAVSFIVLCLLATILYKQGTSSVFKTVAAPARQTESNMRSMAQQEADEAAAAAAAAAATAEESSAAAEATPEETKDAAPAEEAAEKTAE